MKILVIPRLILIVLALGGLGCAALPALFYVIEYPVSIPMASLLLLHQLPSLTVAVLLFRANVWTAFCGGAAILVLLAVASRGIVSWAAENSSFGGEPCYHVVWCVAVVIPAVLMRLYQVVTRPKTNATAPATSKPSTKRVPWMRGGIVGILGIAFATLLTLNFADFQSGKWVYMYQAYCWPGYCCPPGCYIVPRGDYTGLYRRWGYYGEVIEESEYLDGKRHGRSTIVYPEFSERIESNWKDDGKHGEEKIWRHDKLIAAGIWRDDRMWSGSFDSREGVVTLHDGEPWSGLFPKDDDYLYIYEEGSIVGEKRVYEGNPFGPLGWPKASGDQRPWVYNWWLGSAVDEENLAREFARYREAGLGGVHVVPIYGAKGAEDRYVDYLSPKWMHMFAFAVEKSASNDLGLDVTTGTGWCFGGPDILPELGCRQMVVKSLPFPANGRLPEDLRPGRVKLQAIIANGPNGATHAISVTDELTADGTISWQPPGDGWTLRVLGHRFAGRMVKRAAPGGEGPMLNPFHAESMRTYLKRFDEAFSATGTALPRAMYHDSYEYSGDWSPDLPDEFARRRGYRIEDELPALAGEGDADRMTRVRCDVSETLSDMMIENVFPQWIRWCRERGIVTRNQAHGSPGNWLDLYALADVPETEMFGHGGPDPKLSQFDKHVGGADRDPLVAKFASSAAHLTNKRLVSAETGTWLAEHFCETFEELKCLVDLMFLAGVNHVFYHGCVYSPDDAAWPGWLFYASTQFNPRNPLWREAPTLNEYVTRCQSILQEGMPDNDVLLYWPIHDAWTDGVRDMTVHDMPVMRGALGRTARVLWTRGYGFDYVSDRLLEAIKAKDGAIQGPGGTAWSVVVVPECRHMPPATLRRMLDLAQQGATVVFENNLPTDVPGLGTLEERRAAFREQLARLGSEQPALAEANSTPTTFSLGKGRVLVGKLEEALVAANVRRETLVDHPGVMFVRRKHDEGRHYLVVNHGLKPLDARLPLATPARSVVILDPMTGRTAIADVRSDNGTVADVRVRLEPGHSLILRTFESKDVRGPIWASNKPLAPLAEIGGPWHLEFVAGGPELPGPLVMNTLESWTNVGDERTRVFAGTARYRCLFDLPDERLPIDPVLLDLGDVKHVARVYLNDECLGASIMRPHRLVVPVGVLRSKRNVLDIEVTNLAANRIRDLDRRKVPWKIFHNTNVVNIRYRPFNAADWPVFDSGLLGPVRIRSSESAEATVKEM